MSTPDRQSLVDPVLSDVALSFWQDDLNFAAAKVFPIVEVDSQSAKYYTFNKADLLRDDMKVRAPGDESAGTAYRLSNDTFNCDVWSTHIDIPDQMRANLEAQGHDPDRNATRLLTRKGLIRRERNFATNYLTTGKWATDVVGGSDFTVWSNGASSTPISDIQTGKEAVLKSTGFDPNVLVLGYQVKNALVRHPDILARVVSGGNNVNPAMVTLDALAAIFEVDRVIVSKAVYSTNVENETTATDFAVGKNAMLCYVTDTPSPEVPSAGYTMAWTGGQMEGLSMTISRMRIDTKKTDRLEIEMAFDEKLTSADMGYFFSAAVA